MPGARAEGWAQHSGPGRGRGYNARVRPRFHAPDLDASAGRGVLGSDEASHLTRVMRLGVGAEIEVFDGRGGMYLARVADVSRQRVDVQLVEQVAPAPEPGLSVTLVMSVLKGDKMDDVVRDAVMMGVSAIHPVVTTRAAVTVAALVRGRRTARWQRIAVSSAKQCGRAVLPPIEEPVSLGAWLGRPAHEPTLVLVEPSVGGGRVPSDVPAARTARVIVGPEGGWTPEEITAITSAGAVPVTLGARTLRADAVALVALAALFEAWRGW